MRTLNFKMIFCHVDKILLSGSKFKNSPVDQKQKGPDCFKQIVGIIQWPLNNYGMNRADNRSFKLYQATYLAIHH